MDFFSLFLRKITIILTKYDRSSQADCINKTGGNTIPNKYTKIVITILKIRLYIYIYIGKKFTYLLKLSPN
jgi:hypothetical protein